MFPAQMWTMIGHLVRVKAPRVLLQLVTLIYMTNGYMKTDLDMVEYFAGGMAVAWSKQVCSNQLGRLLLIAFQRSFLKHVPFSLHIKMNEYLMEHQNA